MQFHMLQRDSSQSLFRIHKSRHALPFLPHTLEFTVDLADMSVQSFLRSI